MTQSNLPAEQKTQPGGALAVGDLPQYLAEMPNTGASSVESLRAYVRPPRLKIVQGQSGAAYKEHGAPGDVLTTPAMIPVARVGRNAAGNPSMDPQRAGEAFYLIPIFHFPEFICWNPVASKGTLSPIRSRSLDPKSALAKICTGDFDKRSAACPEFPAEQLRYREHINYVVMPLYIDNVSEPHLLSFAGKEFKTGAKFGELILSRRRRDIFAGVYQFCTAYRKNEKGEWYGFNIGNPGIEHGVSPWVPTKDLYDWLKSQNELFADLYAQGAIDTSADADDDTTVDGVASPSVVC
jgi:hypothetical protein